MAKKLELNKETLRDLSEVDLAEVAGGASTGTCPKTTGTTGLTTQTPVCPSGATWFASCGE
ncbi:MAG TPA: class I lanthipeptide [Actinomycetota bacterium]|nr:class I lanthipeptide [Actinomycetota bacterium]